MTRSRRTPPPVPTFRDRLCAALGLAPDASDVEVLATANALRECLKACQCTGQIGAFLAFRAASIKDLWTLKQEGKGP